eukprot:TRINITY_DN7943_c5_g1_i1.p1 TRINITY_DN7943_c5_g1~~TRINITY_DN7943_c5_g1_i1.p1  ORF type:complete len:233 (+),score=47.79 TRINITY_DN7943_c5_g1_i1:56-700(+)
MGVTSHWMANEDVNGCPLCEGTFGWLKRKHHCRCCGGIFCDACSKDKRVLASLGYDTAVRVCSECADAEDGVIKYKYDYNAYEDIVCEGDAESPDSSNNSGSQSNATHNSLHYAASDDEDEAVTGAASSTSVPISFRGDSDSEGSADEQKPSNHHSRRMKMTTNNQGLTIWAASASLTPTPNRPISYNSYRPTAPKEVAKSYQSTSAKRVTFSM